MAVKCLQGLMLGLGVRNNLGKHMDLWAHGRMGASGVRLKSGAQCCHPGNMAEACMGEQKAMCMQSQLFVLQSLAGLHCRVRQHGSFARTGGYLQASIMCTLVCTRACRHLLRSQGIRNMQV